MKKKNKKIIVSIIILIVLFSIVLILILIIKNNKTKTFDYKGTQIALTIDGVSSSSFPSSGEYTVNVSCDNAKGRWNAKTWKLEVTKITGVPACQISFTTGSDLLSSKMTTAGTSGNGTITNSTYGYRYQGNNPDNYVWFNDEMWRIIGYVPVCLTSGCSSTVNRVKIIRKDSIGAFVYKANTTNDATWMDSTIQKLLNTCYLGN